VNAISLDHLTAHPKQIEKLTHYEASAALVQVSALSLALASRLAVTIAARVPAPDRLPDVDNKAGQRLGAAPAASVPPPDASTPGRAQAEAVMPDGRNGHREYISLAECARRATIKMPTLWNWISQGKVSKDQGLCRIGGKRAIDWAMFEATMIQGSP